jgi:hypothetical protein
VPTLAYAVKLASSRGVGASIRVDGSTMPPAVGPSRSHWVTLAADDPGGRGSGCTAAQASTANRCRVLPVAGVAVSGTQTHQLCGDLDEVASSVDSSGSGKIRRAFRLGGSMRRSATKAVQPVWWVAPGPASLSPRKYSKKSRLSFHAGSLCSVFTPEDGAAPVGSREPDADQPSRKVGGNVAKRGKLSRSGRKFDPEFRADELVVLEQGSNYQAIDREPDRSGPIRVAAVHRGP